MTLTIAAERANRVDAPAATGSRKEIPAQPVIKPRALTHGDGPGRAPISRTPKPVESIGRYKARCYCPTCGQKRRACKCEGGER